MAAVKLVARAIALFGPVHIRSTKVLEKELELDNGKEKKKCLKNNYSTYFLTWHRTQLKNNNNNNDN